MEGAMFGVMPLLSSQVTATFDGALLSWRWLSTCMSMGSGFALLVNTSFFLLTKMSLPQPMSSLTFIIPIRFPLPLKGE